jgi:hypothetical protein
MYTGRERHELAVVRRRLVVGPQRLDRLDVLVGARAPARAVDVDHVELLHHPADADAKRGAAREVSE